jgi:hypothetical protein
MDDVRRRRLGAELLAGVLYTAAALVTAALAGAAGSSRMVGFWRLSAFVFSGVVILVHAGYEHYRLRSTAWQNAWHVGIGAALGGFGIALAANIHDIGSAAGYRPKMLIALFAWPLLTAMPAVVAAFVTAYGLGMIRPRAIKSEQP